MTILWSSSTTYFHSKCLSIQKKRPKIIGVSFRTHPTPFQVHVRFSKVMHCFTLTSALRQLDNNMSNERWVRWWKMVLTPFYDVCDPGVLVPHYFRSFIFPVGIRFPLCLSADSSLLLACRVTTFRPIRHVWVRLTWNEGTAEQPYYHHDIRLQISASSWE